MKLWDLGTQHCVQTVVAHRSEIWSLDIDAQHELIFTGSSEGEMKAWKIDHDALAEGLKESSTGEVSRGSNIPRNLLLVEHFNRLQN